MGPASDRRGQHPEKPATFPPPDHYTALTMDVRWLQEKFDELLKQQQDVLLTLSTVLTRLDALEEKAERASFKLDGPGPLVPGVPEDDFDFRGPSRFTE